MKANGAPEKLYIALSEFTEDGRTFVLDHHTDYPICTEYIRADAFIDKASEFIEQNITGYIDVTHKGGDENITLQSEFVNYFKEFMKI